MKRIIRRVSTIVYALGIVSGLTFGASEALGRGAQTTCWYDPPTHLGACILPDPVGECDARCKAYGDDAQGRCLGDYPGCCTCLLR